MAPAGSLVVSMARYAQATRKDATWPGHALVVLTTNSRRLLSFAAVHLRFGGRRY